jgi:microcystin-dependent protein
MRAALSSSFDSTGLGKWDMKGWAVANGANGTLDLRSRFPVAYDPRNADPGGNLWDVAYNTPGTAGGEKAHTLSTPELPAHRHGPDTIGENDPGLIKKSVTGASTTVDAIDASGSGTEPNITSAPIPIPLAGGGGAHENRPPFRVLVFIQRIS